jgi:hypothetical protein
VSVSLLTVVEAPVFARRAGKLLTIEEHAELILYLASHPDAGDEIPGSGGVRKVRFAAKGRGKSGGVRAVYYYYDYENPLYAILLYGKNEQADLSSEQKREVTALATEFKALAKTRRTEP